MCSASDDNAASLLLSPVDSKTTLLQILAQDGFDKRVGSILPLLTPPLTPSPLVESTTQSLTLTINGRCSEYNLASFSGVCHIPSFTRRLLTDFIHKLFGSLAV